VEGVAAAKAAHVIVVLNVVETDGARIAGRAQHVGRHHALDVVIILLLLFVPVRGILFGDGTVGGGGCRLRILLCVGARLRRMVRVRRCIRCSLRFFRQT
jgi:acetyl-CoA carboxylase alpha subunit